MVACWFEIFQSFSVDICMKFPLAGIFWHIVFFLCFRKILISIISPSVCSNKLWLIFICFYCFQTFSCYECFYNRQSVKKANVISTFNHVLKIVDTSFVLYTFNHRMWDPQVGKSVWVWNHPSLFQGTLSYIERPCFKGERELKNSLLNDLS